MEWSPPAKDLEYGLAHDLLARNGLPLAILEALVGQAQRWSDLKPLIGSKGDENLRKSLLSLRNKGLIRPGIDLFTKQKVYALSNLGRLTILKVHEMKPAHDVIEAYRRGFEAPGRPV